MTEWRRVTSDTLCGLCGQAIRKGEPARFMKLPGVKRERVRCENCVGGEAPPDLPLLIERSTPIQPSFTNAKDVLPKRTRGSLRELAERPEWTPYRDAE